MQCGSPMKGEPHVRGGVSSTRWNSLQFDWPISQDHLQTVVHYRLFHQLGTEGSPRDLEMKYCKQVEQSYSLQLSRITQGKLG